MRNRFLSAVAFGVMTMTSHAFSYPVHAACVGGPKAPSYAFDSWDAADTCAQRVASFSKQCAAFVRTGTCRAESVNVDAVSPGWCECNAQTPAVGYWEPGR